MAGWKLCKIGPVLLYICRCSCINLRIYEFINEDCYKLRVTNRKRDRKPLKRWHSRIVHGKNSKINISYSYQLQSAYQGASQ